MDSSSISLAEVYKYMDRLVVVWFFFRFVPLPVAVVVVVVINQISDHRQPKAARRCTAEHIKYQIG